MKRIRLAMVTAIASLALAGCPGNGDGDTDVGGDDAASQDVAEDTRAEDGTGDSGPTDAQMDVSQCTLDRSTRVNGSLAIYPLVLDSNVDPNANLQDSQMFLAKALLALGGDPPAITENDNGTCVDARREYSTMNTSEMWTFDAVETDTIGVGLVSIVDDQEETGSKFVQTATGLAAASDLEAGDAGVSEVTDVEAFAVTEKTVDTIANASSKSRSDLMNPGIMLGRFLDDQGNPVQGIQVGKVQNSPSGGEEIGNIIDSAIYPNQDYSDATTAGNGGSTSSTGVFVVPDQGRTTFGGTKDSTSDSSLDTSTQEGATASQTVFTMTLTVNSGS